MKMVIQDTADVYFRRKSDGHLAFTAEAQLASLSGAISEEKLYGGIGNKPLYILKTQKELALSVRNAFFDLDFLAMSQGEDVQEDVGVKLFDREHSVKVADDNSVELKGKPLADHMVTFYNKKNQTYQVISSSDGKYTLPIAFVSPKETVTAVFHVEKTGRSMSIKASRFSERYEVEYRTIAYNPETEQVYSDIVIQFPNVSPSGEFELSLENGQALTPEFKFEALADMNTDNMAVISEIPRDQPEKEAPAQPDDDTNDGDLGA
ncbi:hypothetical protein QJS65_10920 [Bacillus altitudinis]|uniref:hypothetical protein n=1 Tax=Bacillus altitudinis TaxID=293387 RepID=UPI0024A82287|nr:hypothetical protein [Bacillus altitudinis]WHF25360.1 hypothetical protein QJS65_10920 [Bacillus altitudinis]